MRKVEGKKEQKDSRIWSGERLGVIIKGESKEIVDLRKNTVFSFINRWRDG